MILRDFLGSLFDVAPIGVSVDHHSGSALAAEQVVDGRFQRFALDVPESHVDGGDRRHRDGAATPVRAAVQILPNVFGLKRIASDKARDEVVGQIRRDGQFPPVQSRIAQSVNPFVSRNLQRDEISSRTSDEYLGIRDLHRGLLRSTSRV